MDNETVPCELCDKPTRMTGSKRCNRCWELERRIQADPQLAKKILNRIKPVEVDPITTARTAPQTFRRQV